MSEPASTDSQKLAELVRGYSTFVWRMLRNMGVRESDLADMCQETFLVVHRKLPTFEGRAPLRSWIYGIALRVASDYRARAHRRYEISVDEPPLVVVQADQEDAVEHARTLQLLDRLLEQLKEDQRDVFVLYEIEELEMREICEILDCKLQTAYSRLHAARAAIKAHLARLSEEARQP